MTAQTECCKLCKFWHRDSLTCRRHAPVVDPSEQVNRKWSMVMDNDWCGDFEEKK